MSDENTFEPELRRIADTLRELDHDDLTVLDPPSGLWDDIAAEIGDDIDADQAVEAAAPVVSLSERRMRRAQRSLLLVAAAAVLVVAGVLAIGARRGSDATLVAIADLSYDPVAFDELGADATARVELIDDGDSFAIAFADAELPTAIDEPADLELWLIEPDATGGVADLVSLGIIDATDHTFAVPAGYDPARYSVVDISVEPRDGDEQHSGRSILRGPLADSDTA